LDPFSSFDLLRRQVDRMFSEFDRQMFGGFANSPFFIDQTFESPRRLEGKGGRRKQQQQLSGKNEGEKKEGEGQRTR